MEKISMKELVYKYEASGEELDPENRLRYAIARTICCGKDAGTPEMKRILTTLAAPEHQTAKQLRSRLLKLFLFADLTASELSYDFAKSVFTEKLRIPFGEAED